MLPMNVAGVNHMFQRVLTRGVVPGILAMAGLSAGCGSSPGQQPPATAQPIAPAPAFAVSVTAISPNAGSTGGGTPVTITGSGFQAPATVTLGGQPKIAFVVNGTTIHFTTALHDVGAVDVVVSNSDGQAGSLAGAYTYLAPQSLNFNGTWDGYALSHPELASGFNAYPRPTRDRLPTPRNRRSFPTRISWNISAPRTKKTSRASGRACYLRGTVTVTIPVERLPDTSLHSTVTV